MNIKAWLIAFRLRTLPLALASIGMASFLAAANDFFSWKICLFSAVTTIFLQILSNLANDYGDTVNGADSAERQGPARMVQSGLISLSSMRRAMALFIVLTLISGIYLLYLSFGFQQQAFVFFFVLGILSIFSALAYTAGRRPYGYIGLGDLSVLLFFGLTGVLGCYYLYAHQADPYLILPALSCGFFSVAVLNVNNIRDIESDKKAGKYSIPVRLGRKKAVIYHWFLLGAGIGAALAFTYIKYSSWTQLLFLIMIPLLIVNGKAVQTKTDPKALDPYLKQMALSTLLFVLLFGLGNLLA